MGENLPTAVSADASADPHPDPASVLQVGLAEFNKLRDEIAGRSASVWTLLGLNATVSSAVAGFVLARQADPRLLLLLPLLVPSLGLLLIDHATNIGNIGAYIDSQLKPLLQGAAGEPRLLRYEEFVDRFEMRALRRLLPFGIPLVLMFTVVPVAALLFTVTRLDTPWLWALWVLGLLVTAVQVGFWVGFLAPPLRRALRRPPS